MIKEPTRPHEITAILFLIGSLSLFLYGVVYIVPNEKIVTTSVPVTVTVIPTVVYTPTPTDIPIVKHTPDNYNVWVDSDFGFYKAWKGEKVVNNTHLNILVGDTVTWVNDDDTNWDLTVSGFFGDHKLRYRYSYTFNETGTHTIFVKARRNSLQTIDVYEQ